MSSAIAIGKPTIFFSWKCFDKILGFVLTLLPQSRFYQITIRNTTSDFVASFCMIAAKCNELKINKKIFKILQNCKWSPTWHPVPAYKWNKGLAGLFFCVDNSWCVEWHASSWNNKLQSSEQFKESFPGKDFHTLNMTASDTADLDIWRHVVIHWYMLQ